jgi:hypothetical protein
MNYRLGGEYSVILMSVRRGAPYRDEIQDDGATLIYEGQKLVKNGKTSTLKRVSWCVSLRPIGTRRIDIDVRYTPNNGHFGSSRKESAYDLT